MPYRKDPAQDLPYLNPKYNPDHPYNLPAPDFSVEDDYYRRLGGNTERSVKEQARLEKEWRKQMLDEWIPPHVPRSWETDARIAERRAHILALTLSPRVKYDHEALVPKNPSISKTIADIAYNPADDPNKTDFRRFANRILHLGYHRFHAHVGEPLYGTEEHNVPEEDICWVMEYTPGECNIIRRKIATMMGEFPAVVDPDNDLYNEDLAYMYERRLYVRCRRLYKVCVRPSHVQIFTSQFKVLP